MLRHHQSQKPSAVLLWGDEEGSYAPVYMSKIKVALVIFTLVFTSLWAIATTSYIIFRDDVLVALSVRHGERVSAYEDRLAKMRAQTDRITSKQLIDQDHFERRMVVIVEKQNTLEAQQKIVRDLSTRLGLARPAPLEDMPVKKASLGLLNQTGYKAAASLIDTLNGVKTGLDSVEKGQVTALKEAETTLKSRNDGLMRLFSDLNIPAPRISDAVGGPYIPASLFAGEAFTSSMVNVEKNILRHMALKTEVQKLPLARPLPAHHEITSGYGTRVDPFNRSYANHAGIDFRGATGDPVRATASGTVVTAGSQGGYGLLVEIEHGHNFTTRYAHLSGFNVGSGERVTAGQVIGYVGSTGRSTGAHLHYEVRRDDSALDPLPFIRLGGHGFE